MIGSDHKANGDSNIPASVDLVKLFEIVRQNNEMLVALTQGDSSRHRAVSRDFGQQLQSHNPAPTHFQI